MASPAFSIIVPAYNNAEFLGDTIQSVLSQTFPDFELIVVNDASPDDVDAVMARFDDPRIRYIVHPENRGLSAARNTGIRAAAGAFIALLDGDDLFHRDKLRLHADFLERNPDVGVSYNARFELDHSAATVREIWRPPVAVDLRELVRTFPFSPSDMVIRREWVVRVDLFDEYHTYVGEDLDINCRLAIAGCTFASVDRALNYRRFHSGRILKNLRGCVEDTIRPLDAIFADPRCPADVLAHRDLAYSTHYLLWSAIAFIQHETEFGQELCRKAVALNPAYLQGDPHELIETLIAYSIADESLDHEAILLQALEQLPPEMAWPVERRGWAVARGFLLRGTRTLIWEQPERARQHFARVLELNEDVVDEHYLGVLAAQILSYEREFGSDAAQEVLDRLALALKRLRSDSGARQLKAQYAVIQAFQQYRAQNYRPVPKRVLSAFTNNPANITNRGLLSILVRSLVKSRTPEHG